MGLVGTREVQPPDARFPKPFMPVWVNIGAPIDPARYRDRESDRLALRRMIDEVMFEIRSLSGQDYVDHYATKTDETMPAKTAGVITSEGLAVNGSDANGSDTGATDAPERRSSASVLNSA